MNIQLIIAALLIAGAVLFIINRFYKTFSRKDKDGGCTNCGTDGNHIVKKHKA